MQNFEDEASPEWSRVAPKFEQSGDYSGEFPRNLEEEARTLIGKYAQVYEQAEVTALVATPEHDEADWQATLANGQNVWFWVDEHHTMLENRVHIVERRG